MMVAGQHGQLVHRPLHQVRIREGAYRVQALRDGVRIASDVVLRRIGVQNDDQQTRLLQLDVPLLFCGRFEWRELGES